MLNTTDYAAASQANFDALLGLTAKAFEGVEQLVALNMQFVKASLDEAAETSQAALSVKDPQALLALQSGLLQPAAEKAAAYGREVVGIVSATKASIEQAVAEQTAGAQKSLLAAVDAASKNAPEGSTAGIALIKSAMAAANNAYDGLQKATRQATAAAEANLNAATDTVVKAAGKAKRG